MRRNYQNSFAAKRRRGRWKVLQFGINRRCAYCACIMTTERGSPFLVTLDHFVPLSAGGADVAFNWVLCCVRCNQDKADHLAWTGADAFR